MMVSDSGFMHTSIEAFPIRNLRLSLTTAVNYFVIR